MLRATLSTTMRAARTKSTGTEPRCIAIPRNCPDGDVSLIRPKPRTASGWSRCKLSDAERAHAHDGRRCHDHGSRGDNHRRRLRIIAGRHVVGRRPFDHVRTLQHFDFGDEGRRTLGRLVVEVPSAAHVPPPSVTTVAPLVPPPPALPGERAAIVAAGVAAPHEPRTRHVSGATRIARPARVAGSRTDGRAGRCPPGVSRPAGRGWTGWADAGRRGPRR